MRTTAGRSYIARVIGKPNASGYSGAVGTGDFAPASWLALSTSAAAPDAANSVLPGEITTGNLAPALGTFAHTEGSQIYTLTKSYTSDQDGVIIRKYGVKNGAAGLLVFENNYTNPAELFSGDQIATTVSVDLG